MSRKRRTDEATAALELLLGPGAFFSEKQNSCFANDANGHAYGAGQTRRQALADASSQVRATASRAASDFEAGDALRRDEVRALILCNRRLRGLLAAVLKSHDEISEALDDALSFGETFESMPESFGDEGAGRIERWRMAGHELRTDVDNARGWSKDSA